MVAEFELYLSLLTISSDLLLQAMRSGALPIRNKSLLVDWNSLLDAKPKVDSILYPLQRPLGRFCRILDVGIGEST